MSRVSWKAGILGDFEDYALQGPTTEGNPDTVAWLHFQTGRDGVGESPSRLQGGVGGDFSERHSQWSRLLAPPIRDEEEWGMSGLGETLLFDPGGLAGALTQVVEPRTPYLAQPHPFQLLEPGRVEEERPLDADGVGHPTHSEVGVDSTVTNLDDRTLEDLDALPGPFDDPVVHLYGVAGVNLVEVGVGFGLDDQAFVDSLETAHDSVAPMRGSGVGDRRSLLLN